ncbi:MAG: hypothetical protein ABJL99_04915 [Aliishimia sp.]
MSEFSYMVRDTVFGRLPGIPADIFPEADLPSSSLVWEMSYVEAKDRASMELMFHAANEYLTDVGATHTIAFTRLSFKGILDRLGYPTEQCGPAVQYSGKPYCALFTELGLARQNSEEMLSTPSDRLSKGA